MPPASTQRTQGKRPGDLTGVRGQQLARAAAKEKAESAAQVAEALEEERLVKLTTEVDYSSATLEKQRADVLAGVVEGDVDVRPRTKRIRVNFAIEDMTFGREVLRQAKYDDNGVEIAPAVLGSLRTYSFEEGRWYTVDIDLADHLTFLGYVYDDGR